MCFPTTCTIVSERFLLSGRIRRDITINVQRSSCKCHGKTRKDGARPAVFLVVVLFYVICVVLCIVCFVTFPILFVCVYVYWTTDTGWLPNYSQIYPILSYIIYHIISYHIISYHISYHILSYHILSYPIISYIITYHILSYHIISSYHIVSYQMWMKLEFSQHIFK